MLTEGEVFENEILSRTESTDNPAQKMPEGNSHGKDLIGTSQIELVVKLLILRVFDLLANDNIPSCFLPIQIQFNHTLGEMVPRIYAVRNSSAHGQKVPDPNFTHVHAAPQPP